MWRHDHHTEQTAVQLEHLLCTGVTHRVKCFIATIAAEGLLDCSGAACFASCSLPAMTSTSALHLCNLGSQVLSGGSEWVRTCSCSSAICCACPCPCACSGPSDAAPALGACPAVPLTGPAGDTVLPLAASSGMLRLLACVLLAGPPPRGPELRGLAPSEPLDLRSVEGM